MAAPMPPRRALIAVAPGSHATRIGQEERRDPRLEPVWADVERFYAGGLHPAIALHVIRKGRVVLDRTIGHLDNQPGGTAGEIVTPNSLFSLFSASKIVTATLIHALVDDGVLSLDTPAAHWIPEFGQHGKSTILVRHLLNHTAGIPDMPANTDALESLRTGVAPLQAICALKPQSEPGKRTAYHPMTSWFVLQEIVERATGRPLPEVLTERIRKPMGLANMNYGVAAARIGEVAKHAVTGPPAPAMMANIFRRSIGADVETAVRMSNDTAFLTAVLPSANVIGQPREMSQFLAMLLAGGQSGGNQILSPQAVKTMTTVVTTRQFDGTFGFPMRYGLGVMMGGRRFALFGLGTTGAFGHLGLSNVVVYADPARDLVVSFLNTGKPMLDVGMLRWYWVLQRIVSVLPAR